MYDHKFRRNDLSFGRTQRRRKRPWVWWALGLAVTLGALYGVNLWRAPDLGPTAEPITGPNIIPLELPPKAPGD